MHELDDCIIVGMRFYCAPFSGSFGVHQMNGLQADNEVLGAAIASVAIGTVISGSSVYSGVDKIFDTGNRKKVSQVTCNEYGKLLCKKP
jgi:hypothetical protein